MRLLQSQLKIDKTTLLNIVKEDTIFTTDKQNEQLLVSKTDSDIFMIINGMTHQIPDSANMSINISCALM